MSRRVLIALGLLTLLAVGCDGLEMEGDKRAQKSLSGVWFAVTEEPDHESDNTVTVHSWLALNADGTFIGRMRGFYPDGRILEGGSNGDWLVTDDRFKLRYISINGKNLRRHDLDTMYAFKLVAVTNDTFTYANPFDQKSAPLTVKRVTELGKEP